MKVSTFLQETRRATWHLAPPPTKNAATQAVDPVDALPTVRDDDDLDKVLRDYLGVKLPNLKCCQGHSTPWEAVHDAFFARSAVAIWKASRGMGGKSYTLSALSMAEAIFLRADVNILGGSGVQSKRVLEAITTMWEHPQSPRHCLIGQPGSEVQKMVWGNRIQALMASQKSVRGPHPQRLRLDEVDEMSPDIFNSALGQPMGKGWVQAHVVGASTHQYPDGMMSKAMQRARTEDGWRLFEWCYRENLEPHGWLSMAEVQRKRAILTVGMWDTEIELQEPSTEGRAMETEKVDLAFPPGVPLDIVLKGTAKGTDGQDRKIELQGSKEVVILEPPVPGAKYGTGADWAKKKNHSVVVTMRHDVVPARLVCITRTNKRPWPDMVADLERQATFYPGTVCHDNTGLGQVVDDLISLPNKEAFDMVGRQRQALLSEYVASIEHGEVQLAKNDSHPPLAALYSEHKYATRDDLYKGTKDGTGKHHLPDTISAGAFAWRACGGTEAASAVRQPDRTEYPNLQHGIQRGRISDYIRGVAHIRTDEDEDDE